MSELGLIDWRDHRYYPGGDGKKGKAMKWDLTDSFMELLVEVTEMEVISQKVVAGSASCPSEETTHTSLYEVVETREKRVVADIPTAGCATCYSTGYTTTTSLYELFHEEWERCVGEGDYRMPDLVLTIEVDLPWWDGHDLDRLAA